jgi:hypothetical protein
MNFVWHEGCSNALERVPIAWTHAIEKDSLEVEDMEHVRTGKPLRAFLRTCSMAREPFEAFARDEKDLVDE